MTEKKEKSLTINNLAQKTKFVIVFFLILSSCAYDTEKRLNSFSTVTDCFTQEEVKDLAKLLDFFNEHICVSEGIDKKEIIKCYDSFIQRMIETAEAGSLDAQIPFTQQKKSIIK